MAKMRNGHSCQSNWKVQHSTCAKDEASESEQSCLTAFERITED